MIKLHDKSKLTGFVPIKLNSERCQAKSVRFLNGIRLLNYPLITLNKVRALDEIIVFCSDESVVDYIHPNLRYTFVKRSEQSNHAREPEFFNEFIEKVRPDWIVGLWPTSPFIQEETVHAMLTELMAGEYDSAHTAINAAGRCWYEDEPLNCDPVRHSHSGELKPVWVEAGDCKILPAELQTTQGRRIGPKPYRHEVNLIEGWDINTEWDWHWAETLVRGPLRARA